MTRRVCSRCGGIYDGVSVHGPTHCHPPERRRAERRSKALLEVPPSLEVSDLERAANQLTRDGHVRLAIPLWALALRLRQEANDAVT